MSGWNHFPDDGKKRFRISESSLPHSLDAIIKKTEGDGSKAKEIKKLYPPEDWPEDEDYQNRPSRQNPQKHGFQNKTATSV